MLNRKDLFDCLKINLMTKSQKQAVLSEETPILLSASAGSGKTFVLSTRVVFKLLNSQEQIYPQDLLVVTFAKSAAKEMFERIYTGSSEDYYKKLKKYVDKGTKKFILTNNQNYN